MNVSPGYTFTGATDPITFQKLNLLGQPTVTLGTAEVVTVNMASGNTYVDPTLNGRIATGTTVDAFSGTISLSVATGINATHTISCTSNTASTINLSAVGTAGQLLWIIFSTDGTGGNVITYGTNFRTTGTHTLTGASKKFTSHFISDGATFNELGRTAALS